MGSSRRKAIRSATWAAVAVVAVCAGGCSVGVGEGSATGQVWAPGCGLDGSSYDLNPTFFGSNPLGEGSDMVEIRAQRGSDSPDVSDGLFLLVQGASDVNAMLDTPIDLASTGTRPEVDMTLYLNDTCPIVIGDASKLPVSYGAVAGTITFSAIYAPEADGSGKETAATFDSVELVDPNAPDERHATLSGDFRFIFSRGRPAQPFP